MVAEAVDSSGFSEAIEMMRQERPSGFRYVLSNEAKLQSAFFAGLEEFEASPFFINAEQFSKNAVYAALLVVARESRRRGRFKRPCCSKWPLTWPVCDTSC